MIQTNTLNFTEFIYKLGNDFFNLKEEDFTPLILDDLNYEVTEKDGLNGYVLKIEETADVYSNVLMKYVFVAFNWIQSFFYKKETSQEPSKNTSYSKKVKYKNTQAAIHNKVRSRLLDLINEDVEYWNINQKQTKQRKPSVVYKNCFKTDIKYDRKTKIINLRRIKHLWNMFNSTKAIE
jgi:hypothetical protein